MPEPNPISEAAAALARKKWRNIPAAERSAHALRMSRAATRKMTKAQRVARARKAVAARIAKNAAEKRKKVETEVA